MTLKLVSGLFAAGVLLFSSCSSQPLGGADPLDGGPSSTAPARNLATSPDRYLDQRFHEESLRQAEADDSNDKARGSAGVSATSDW